MTANDRHLTETRRRDILTGLLNSRGISEEASIFRDEYYLRGTDFVRIHIAVNDMGTLNEQYGFDFGDRVLKELGKALRHAFGRASAVGRYAGNKFAILQQIQSREEANSLRDKIKAIGASIKKIKGVPVTLYLSVGYTLFSEVLDKAEQTKISEIRLHADHDNNISAKSRLGNMADIFRLFDDLPVSYSVYHVTHAEHSGLYDAVIFYVNHKYEEFGGRPAREILGHSTRELYPSLDEEWYRDIKRAAFDGESVEREYVDAASGKRYAFKARQILYPGYCAAGRDDP